MACGDNAQERPANANPAASGSTGEEAANATTAPPAEEAPGDGSIVIVPGISIGPLRIDMTRAEVDGLGVLSPHPQYSAMTIPYTVYDDADRKHEARGGSITPYQASCFLSAA